MSEYIKKITARTVDTEKKPGEAFVVMGRILRAKPDESTFGPYVKFTGQFLAINENTGKEYQSAAFISPGIMEDELLASLLAAQSSDQTASVEFAARFKTKEDKKSAIGYVWVAEMLEKPSVDDPTFRLREAIRTRLNLPEPEPEKKK